MTACLNKDSLFFKTFPFKWILARIKKDLNKYISKFSRVLDKHLRNEFEVPIKFGKITETGEHVLNILEEEFSLLQYEDVVTNMISES